MTTSQRKKMTTRSTHTAHRYWWLGALPHYDDVSFLQNPTCAVVKSMLRSTATDPPEEFYLACKFEKTVFTAGENVKGKLSVYVDKSFPCQRLDIYLKCICFLSVPKSTAKHQRSASAIYATANVWTSKEKEKDYHIPYGMNSYVFDLQLPRIVRATTVDNFVSVVYAILVDFHQTGLELHERFQAFAGYVKVYSQPYIERSISQVPTSCSDTVTVVDRSGLLLGSLRVTMSLKSCLLFTKSKIFIQVLIQCEHIKTKFKLLEIFPALIQDTVFIGKPQSKCQRAIVYLKNDSRNNIARKKREIRHSFEMDVGDIIPTTFPADQESKFTSLQVNYFMILLIKHEYNKEYNIVTRQPVTVVHQESYHVTTKNCEKMVSSLHANKERTEPETSPEHPELRVFNFGPSFKNSTMHLFFLEFHAQLKDVLPFLRELNSKLIYVYSFISLGKSCETCEEWTMINYWLRYYQDLLEPTLMGIENIEDVKKVIQETITNFYKPWLLETHFSTKPYEVMRNLLKDMISKITEMIHWILNEDNSGEGPQLQLNECSTSHKPLAPIPFNACKLWFGWTANSACKQSKSILVKTFVDESMINELNLKSILSPLPCDLTQIIPYEQSCQFFSLDDTVSANLTQTTTTVSANTGSTKTSKSMSHDASSDTKSSTKSLPAKTQSDKIEPQETSAATSSEANKLSNKINDTLDVVTESVNKRKILTASKKQRSRPDSAIKKKSQNNQTNHATISNNNVGSSEEKVDVNWQTENMENNEASEPNVLTDNISKEKRNSETQSKLCQTNDLQNNQSPKTRYLKHKNKTILPKNSLVQDLKSISNADKQIHIKTKGKKNKNSTMKLPTPNVKHSAKSSNCMPKKTNSPEYKCTKDKEMFDRSKPTYNSKPVDRPNLLQTDETVKLAKFVQAHQTCNAQATDNVETSSEIHVEASSETHVETTSSETHVKASSETHVEALSEIHVEVSSETNVKNSSETNVENSSETHVKTSSETHVETSSETQVETSGETHVETFSEMNVEAYSETHVEASSEIHVETSSETNVEASSETHVEASSETHVEASSETHVEASIETHVEAFSETHVEASSETNIEASSETNVEASSEIIVEAFSETHVNAFSETHVKAFSETHVKAFSEAHVKAFSEAHVEAFSETHVETSSETHVKAFSETNVEAFRETNVETSSETHVENSSETNVETFSQTNFEASSEFNAEISAQFHNSDSPKNSSDKSTLTQNIVNCMPFPLLANEAPSGQVNNVDTTQTNIQAQRTDSKNVVSALNNSPTKFSRESRTKSEVLSSCKISPLESHLNAYEKANEHQSKLQHLTEKDSVSLEDSDKLNAGYSDLIKKACPSLASKILVQSEIHNTNIKIESINQHKSCKSIHEISSTENSINSSRKGFNNSSLHAEQLSTKKTKIADRLWTLSRKSLQGKSPNLKEDLKKDVINCVEKTSLKDLIEPISRYIGNHSLVNSVQKNGMQVKIDNKQDIGLNMPVDMETKFRNKLLFEGSTFDGRSHSCDSLSSNTYQNVKQSEVSTISSEIHLLKEHRLQNPLMVNNTLLKEQVSRQQEIKCMNVDSTNNNIGVIKSGTYSLEPTPSKIIESVKKYKHLVPVPVSKSKTYKNSQVCINEKHKNLNGLNIGNQNLPSEPLKHLYRPLHDFNYSQNLSEPITRTMDKRGKHLPVSTTRPHKLLPELMTMPNKPFHEPVKKPLKLLAEPSLGQKFALELPDIPQNEPHHKSHIPVSLQRHKSNKVQLRIDQPVMLATCAVTSSHPNGTNNVIAISDGQVTPPSGRCTPLEELKYFLFGLADESQNKEVNSKDMNESLSEGPFRVPRFEKDKEILWEDSIIDNINLQHTGIWSHNVCNMWATNFNYGDCQSISARPDVSKVTKWKKTVNMQQSKLNPSAPAFVLSGENLSTTQQLFLNREGQIIPCQSDLEDPFGLLKVLSEKYAAWIINKKDAYCDASTLNTIECEMTTLCTLLSSQLQNNKTAMHLLDYFMQRIQNSNISVQPVTNSLNYPQAYGHSDIPQFAQKNLPMTVFNSQDLQYADNLVMGNDFHVTNNHYSLDSGAYWLDFRACQVNQVHGRLVNPGQLAIGFMPILEYQHNSMLPYSRTHF